MGLSFLLLVSGSANSRKQLHNYIEDVKYLQSCYLHEGAIEFDRSSL